MTRAVLGGLGALLALTGGGFLLGVGAAAAFGSTEPVWLTASWSYVPADQWLVNGLVWASYPLVLVGSVQAGGLLVALLARARLLIAGGGAMLVAMGVGMGGLAAGLAELDGEQRLMFGVMGPGLALFGLAMIAAEVRARLAGR